MRRATIPSAVLAFFHISNAAQAEIINIIFSGTVSSGTDGAGIFGGSNLGGSAYAARFTLDTSAGKIVDSGHGETDYNGGPAFSTSPSISVAFTIGGITKTIIPGGPGGGDQLALHSPNPPGFNGYGLTVSAVYEPQTGNILTDHDVINGAASLDFPLTISSNYTHTFSSDEDAKGSFHWRLYDVAARTYFDDTDLVLHPAIIEVEIGSVPEATTWAMMLLGFAGIGMLTYGRKARHSTRV